MKGFHMTDRQTIIEYILAGILLLLLFVLSLVLEGNDRKLLLKEGGWVESATALAYFFCAAFIVYKGKLTYLKKYPHIFLLIIFFMLRELDFDSRFTTTGIFKIRFFTGSNVPLTEKIIGAIVILLLLYIIFIILYRHTKDFISGLKKHSIVDVGVLISCIVLAVSQSLDGLDRKLKSFGIIVSKQVSMHAGAAEEMLELGVPIFFIITLSAYFRTKSGKEDSQTGKPSFS
jgi:hypothetical protein